MLIPPGWMGGGVTDESWVVPALIFVAAQYLIALLVSSALDVAATPPIYSYFLIGFVVMIGGGLLALARVLWPLIRNGEQEPLSVLLPAINWRGLLIASIGIQLVVLQVGSLTWLKSMMPLVVPFWADPALADLDRAIFGTDPWRLLVFMKPAEMLIDGVYAAWFPVKSYVMLALLVSLPSFKKSRAILAYFYTIGLFGVLGQYAFSSAGPLFYELAGYGNRFADMPLPPLVESGRNYLWAAYTQGSETIGGGISAMPSIHVALAAWVGLVAQTTYRPLAVLGWGFYAMIAVGSVYLGWHYAVDSIAGTIAAFVSWGLSGTTLAYTKKRLLAAKAAT